MKLLVARPGIGGLKSTNHTSRLQYLAPSPCGGWYDGITSSSTWLESVVVAEGFRGECVVLSLPMRG